MNIEECTIEFDKNNANAIIIKKENRIITIVACPPISCGCDIINFNSTSNDYDYNFKGLILITSLKKRKLYYKGELITKIKRNTRK